MPKKMSDSKRVLIVIVSYNGAEYIGDCLSSVYKSTYPRADFKVLIVDNASTDNTVELIKNQYSDVALIEKEKNVGFVGGNNIGMQYAIDHSYDYVYLLNQDTVVEPNFLDQVVDLAETKNDIAAVQSKLLLFENKEQINSVGNQIHYLGFGFAGGHKTPDRELSVQEITYASGAAMLVRVSVLKDIGLFNKDFFMYHEDTDLGWRMWLAGYRVLLEPSSIVYHKYEFSRSIKKFYYMERNRYLTIFQNYHILTILVILPALLIMDGAMFVYSFFAGWWKENFRVFTWLWSPKAWRMIQKTRRRVQATRKRSDREIIQKFVGRIEFQDLQNPLLNKVANPLFDAYWKVAQKFIWW